MDGELVPDNAVLGGTNVLGSSGLPSPRCDYEAGISITIEVPATSNDVIDSYGHCRKRGIAMKLKESIFERYKQKSGASQGSIRIMQSAPGAILGSYFARDGVCKYFPTGRIQLSLFK